MNEIVACHKTAELSYRNPMKKVHSITNSCLQSVDTMRQPIELEKKHLIKNLNSREEIQKACKANNKLKKPLWKAQLKGNKFKIVEVTAKEYLTYFN